VQQARRWRMCRRLLMARFAIRRGPPRPFTNKLSRIFRLRRPRCVVIRVPCDCLRLRARLPRPIGGARRGGAIGLFGRRRARRVLFRVGGRMARPRRCIRLARCGRRCSRG
jgi:hypothetical protein